jgi:thiamine biosynthesis lipoprotein
MKGPARVPRKPAPLTLSTEAMNTRFELVLADARAPASLRAAGEAALDEIVRVEADLSAFRRDSILTQLNVEAATRPVRVDGETFRFLVRAGELARITGGAFDLTIGALMEPLRAGRALTAAARARVGFRRVRLDAEGQTVRFTARGVRLDPGAIGKGYAVDRAVGLLREAGIGRALLHGGTSSVYGLGAPPGARAWQVAVQDPMQPEGRIARVALRDRALGVSCIYGRTFVRGQERHGHVIDPRSGRPVDHTLLAAVVTDLAADADALSTALLVLGRAGLRVLARRFPAAGFLVAERGEVLTAGDGFRLT